MNSLREVWEFALANSSENKVKEWHAEQALQEKRTAGSFLFPTISAVGNGQHNIDIAETPVPGEIVGQPGETVYTKFGKAYSYSAGININYNPLDWQSIYRKKMAEVNVQLKEAEKDYFEQTLKEQVGQLYYATLTAQKAVEIGQQDLAVADTLLFLTEQRFTEGTTDAIALNQARVNRNTVDQNLESTRQYYNECLSNLKILIGFNADDKLVLTENLSNESSLSVVSQPVQNIRYTEIYRLQEIYVEKGVKKAKADFIPQLGFHAYFGYNQYQDDFTMSFQSGEWKPNNYLGLSLNIPVFTGFANKSKYKSAKINRQIATRTYEDELRKSAINDSLLYSKTISASKIARAGLENFHLSSDNIKLAAQKYEQGLLSLDGYLNIFDDYLKSESLYLNKLSEFLINKASIESRKQ
jgi:outer membrane protein TolC